MMNDIQPVALAMVETARRRTAVLALYTPAIVMADPADRVRLHLKLENLQPVGSFKIRPIGNAVLSRSTPELADGIYTSSSGNSALGVAWMAKRLGIAATALVPDNAPEAKLAHLRALGTEVVKLPFAAWWRAIQDGGQPDQPGRYIDAVRDAAALAGDGVIGLEILEQVPDVEAIFVPFGGGGLACGIACAVKALRPEVRIVACELDSAQPLNAAFKAGRPVEVEFATRWISGVGVGSVLPEMWPLIRAMVDEVVTVSFDAVADAVRAMADRHHVIAEGAGGIAVAAALGGGHGYTRVAAVVSGGNIGAAALSTILQGGMPD